ncbi:metal-dependent hydrolase family protein [Lacibacter sediminis]|uniref:Amidohydrolase family protein n=1 Tax=Lacibacter sediminis TaxID=2760713 RepID=A0A7G5XHJ5_9BACT|nr:amidohydrolase family protein [Lacibacter sediminis]QNA44948.1 amidohydrolase family protein [Lacibacter sediminis]
MRKIISLLLLQVIVLFSFAQQKSIAIQCGKMLDVRTGKILINQVILVKGNKIESITDAANFKQKTDSVIDLKDYFILPGLIDCHTHVLLQGDITTEDYDVQVLKESIPYRTLRASKSAHQSLLNGFTTIRDLGTEGAGYADVDIKKAINKNIIPGPRMFVSTLAINTTGHYLIAEKDYAWELKLPKGLQEITGADEGRKAVRTQIAYGADWIKIYADRGYVRLPNGGYKSIPNFTKEEIEAIADETLKSRKKLAAHAVTPDGIIYSINAGASSIEHGFGMNEECMQLMAKKNVFWCPTIYVNDFVAEGRAKAGSPINKYFTQSEPEVFKKAMSFGVKIAYGTDIGGYDWNEPQTKDFEFFVQYGMQPLQAIQTATINAAELLEQTGLIGELIPGAFADIIAVKENPLSNIKVLGDVKWVMKDGKVYKQSK